jgi:hypothetical protein
MVWNRIQKINQSSGGIDGIAADGNYMVLYLAEGVIVIYEREKSGRWTEKKRIEQELGGVGSTTRFIDISGNTIVFIDLTQNMIFWYLRNKKGDWVENCRITNSDISGDSSVAISGNYTLLGCEGAGKIYFYLKDSKGVWREKQIIPGTPPFCSMIDIDGNYAVSTGVTGGEKVFFYERKKNGAWSLVQTLNFDVIKTTISGNYAIISESPLNKSYLYERQKDGIWRLNKTISRTLGGYKFTSIDGNYAVLSGGSNGTAVYIRDKQGSWQEDQIIKDSSNDSLSTPSTISGDYLFLATYSGSPVFVSIYQRQV